MSQPNEDTSLELQTSDYVAAAAKSVLGAVPFAGSLLVEIAGHVIPNQRIDRLAKFAAELEARIAGIHRDLIRTKLADENFTDLVEETMRHAARAVTDERRRYLASILTNGINSADISHIESKHLLRILGELNDLEVVWLRSYLNPSLRGEEEFLATHKEVLYPRSATIGSSQSELDKAAIQESYKQHLTRLGLLEPRYETDMRTRQPVFDTLRGGLKIRGHDITLLGRLLLRQIDLSDGES